YNLVVRMFGLALALAPFSGPAFAQGVQGTITGQVTDPSGAAIPGAAVKATNTATNAVSPTQAGAAGNFSIPAYPGAYRLEVEADGFKRSVRDVTVAAATTVRVDVVLEIGSVSETVEVSGALLTVQTE